MSIKTDTCIDIVLAYAPKQDIHLLETVTTHQGATALQVLEQSKLVKAHPEILKAPLGVFGKSVDTTYVLQANDRLEIYRPLVLDPKQQRLNRLKK